jgi:branched-chain amino acid transport system substrate-binding protein
MAVAANSLWVINPGGRVVRIDRAGRRVIAEVGKDATTLAVGDTGIWFAADGAVAHIDPRTNRVAQRIRVGANRIGGIAVGGGAVWAAAEHEGVVWRIDPGPHPVMRTIDVGPGVSFLAYADGALWAANYVDGRLSRIDPRTNAITSRLRIGAPQALAAGAGRAWVSVAGAARGGRLPPSSCGPVESGGQTPDVLIASDLPLHGPTSVGPKEMAAAIRLVLERHGFQAGRYAVGWGSCDASTAQSGVFEPRRCGANANAYAAVKRLVAVIGPYNSQCTAVQLPILNRAHGGPIATVSPSNTYPGLTRPVSVSPEGGGYRGEPGVFYPTGVRNFMTLGAGDDLAGTADAMLADALGLHDAYLLDAGDGTLNVLVTQSFRYAARRLGIHIAGASTFDPRKPSFADVADRVARSGADHVVIAADIYLGADRLLKALRARLGDKVTLMAGSFGFVPLSEVLKRAGRASHGLYVSSIDEPAPLRGASRPGHALARELGTPRPQPYVLEAAQATELVLAAIARSDGSRASVLRALRASQVRDGILGTFRLDANGDMTPPRVTILRLTGSTPPGSELNPGFEGAVVDRILHVPPELVEGAPATPRRGPAG